MKNLIGFIFILGVVASISDLYTLIINKRSLDKKMNILYVSITIYFFIITLLEYFVFEGEL